MKKIIFIVFMLPFLVFSQNEALSKADQKFNNLEYIEAIKIYEKLVKKGQSTPHIFEKLANAYYNNGSYAVSNNWFEKLYELNPNMGSENQYRFSQTLKAVANLIDSEKQLKLFENANPDQIRAKLLKSKNKFKSNFVFSNIKLLSINSDASDFGTVIKGDTLLFSSSKAKILTDKISLRTGQYNTSFYKTVKDKNGEYSSPKLFSLACYSVFNETTPAFSSDGKVVYYTQNFVDNDTKDKLINAGFKLYKSTLKNGLWEKSECLTFSQKDSVNMAHPAVSPDGKFLYFASDMSGSIGASDLFRISINQEGVFGEIERLSNKINTEGRESFPFVTENNILIFASNGHPGIGGLDLYSIDLTNPDAEVISLGPIINSAFDDFGLVLNQKLDKGFFTSNRPGGIGNDDIYSFDTKEVDTRIIIAPTATIDLKGTIKDEVSDEALANVSIALINKASLEIAKTKTDAKGDFSFYGVQPNSDYTLKLTKFGKLVRLIPITTIDKDLFTLIILSKKQVVPKVDISKIDPITGVDLSKALQIEQIYFDYNKFDISLVAQIELDYLVAYMNLHPTITIEIGSHTDCIGSTAFNLLLSQKRANATANYIVSQGIDSARLNATGYGESKLENNCSDGVPCTAEQNQENRRSTFVIRNK